MSVSDYPDYVCFLQKFLHGLKQVFRAWDQRFANFVTIIGFCNNILDNSLFIYCHGLDIAYLLLYVDDIILTVYSNSIYYVKVEL